MRLFRYIFHLALTASLLTTTSCGGGENNSNGGDNDEPIITPSYTQGEIVNITVLDYMPAPGQFVNQAPEYTAGDNITIEDNVMISAGAKILGSFTIGENSKIGAGSVVLNEVPPNSTVVGVPGRVIKQDNVRIPRVDLDQVHLPDPVKLEFEDIRREIEKLKSKL